MTGACFKQIVLLWATGIVAQFASSHSCLLDHSGVTVGCLLDHSGVTVGCLLHHSGVTVGCLCDHSGDIDLKRVGF